MGSLVNKVGVSLVGTLGRHKTCPYIFIRLVVPSHSFENSVADRGAWGVGPPKTIFILGGVPPGHDDSSENRNSLYLGRRRIPMPAGGRSLEPPGIGMPGLPGLLKIFILVSLDSYRTINALHLFCNFPRSKLCGKIKIIHYVKIMIRGI